MMLWFVALVAIVNLLIGYAIAVLSGTGRTTTAAAEPESATTNATGVAVVPQADTFELITPEKFSEPVAINPTTSPPTQPTSFEHVAHLLAEITGKDAADKSVTVALLELDTAKQLEKTLDERLLHGVASTIQELLSEVGTVARYGGHQLLLTLPKDEAHDATERAEQVRQRIQATQFVADGQSLQTTITCALVDVEDRPVLKLLECLETTLAEAKRCGGNRTFLHNGTAPTPVALQELSVPSQKCTI